MINWTAEHVAQFFNADLHLPQYCPALLSEEVDGAMFLDLFQTEGGLSDLGITSKVHLSKIKTKLGTLDTSTHTHTQVRSQRYLRAPLSTLGR